MIPIDIIIKRACKGQAAVITCQRPKPPPPTNAGQDPARRLTATTSIAEATAICAKLPSHWLRHPPRYSLDGSRRVRRYEGGMSVILCTGTGTLRL